MSDEHEGLTDAEIKEEMLRELVHTLFHAAKAYKASTYSPLLAPYQEDTS